MDLAKDKLLKHGYEFYIDFTITRENFDEMGEFLNYFRKYVYSIFNIRFHFMNSLAPNNNYFINNNTIT